MNRMIVSPFFRMLKIAENEKRTSREAGFSLVEILLSIVLIGALSMSVLSALQVAAGQLLDLRRHYQALALAEAGMEKIFYYRDVQGYDYLKSENFPDETDPDGVSGFTRSYIFTSLSSLGKKIGENMKQVTVRVSWDKGSEELIAGVSRKLWRDTKASSYVPYWE